MKMTEKPLTPPPGLAVAALMILRRTLQKAADSVVPAQLAMFERITGVASGQVLCELARLGVPDLLADGPLTAAQLADKTKTDAGSMLRAMRGAVAMGVFDRRSDGRYENNRLSNALRSGDLESVRSFATYFGSKSNVLAWADIAETMRTGKNAFERVHKKSVWDWFDEHPDERETFAHAMMGLTLVDAPGIATTYPFGEIGTLCDVGGGRGTLLSELLLHHPKLRGMLCDAPGVLDSAKKLLTQRGVAERVELVAGNFFDSVPKGADAYSLKNILHDWDDERSIKILKNVRSAMEPGKKVLVIEAVVEEDNMDFGAMVDLQMMMVCCDGRERGRKDFERLFDASGFRLTRIVVAPTLIAVIEGVAV